MQSILVVEDDKLLNEGVKISLKKAGYMVYSALCLEESKLILKNHSIDLALIDINLPDGNGTELAIKIKNEKLNIKIVFFTANDTEEDMIKGYEMGCEDYISKPFSLKVLIHKIKVILNRERKSKHWLAPVCLDPKSKSTFLYKALMIDYDKVAVYKNNQIIKLTATEYNIIKLLSKNKGHVLTKDIILGKIWDTHGNFVDENTLSVNIQRLRKKIEDDPKNPEFIITVFGIGYTFGE